MCPYNKKRLGLKAQSAGSAAIFIIILGALIVAYILLIPPEERAELLGEDISGTGGSGTSGISGASLKTTLLDETIGRLDYLKFDERTHELPSFRIQTSTEALALKTETSVYVKNSAFGEKFKDVSFDIEKERTSNLLLSFNVEESAGRLIIYLNSMEIFNNKLMTGSPLPVVLPKEYLMDHNTLRFQTESTGWLFWRVNEYTLTNLVIAADVKDYSKSYAEQRFFISEEEKDNLDKAVLWFYPACEGGKNSALMIKLNGRQIFNAVPDCGINSHIEVSVDNVMSGENTLTFETADGRFLIDQLKFKTELEDLIYPIYYFELDDNYFVSSQRSAQDEAYCGNIDGICPSGCDEDDDRDCCFDDSQDNYWCDLETDNNDDRCVGFLEQATLSRCPSGYEDSSGDIAEIAEDLCGDDSDDSCPTGCSIYYDMDCCFAQSENNYWCDDLPKTGVSSICEADVSSGECNDCPSGYYSKERGSPDCPDEEDDDEIDILNRDYDVNLTIKFTDDRSDHKADLIINGRTIRIDNRNRVYSRMIDDYVETGTNSVEIVPKTTLDIVRLTVQVQKRAR